jgi:hypothetical protein
MRRRVAMIFGGTLALGSIVAMAAMSTEQGRDAVADATGAVSANLQAVPRHLRTENDPKLIKAQNARFQIQNAGLPWSYSVKGDHARFEVRPGDSMAGDGAVKERSEIATSQKMKHDRLYDIAFNLMIEPGPANTARWMTLVQIQSTPDPGEPGHSPPFAIEMVGERMRVITRHDPNPRASSATTVYTSHYTDPKPLERGRWYRFHVRSLFKQSGDGLLEVSRDGVTLVNYRGPMGFNDRVGPYWKEGVYRESSKEAFAANYKSLKIRSR